MRRVTLVLLNTLLWDPLSMEVLLPRPSVPADTESNYSAGLCSVATPLLSLSRLSNRLWNCQLRVVRRQTNIRIIPVRKSEGMRPRRRIHCVGARLASGFIWFTFLSGMRRRQEYLHTGPLSQHTHTHTEEENYRTTPQKCCMEHLLWLTQRICVFAVPTIRSLT